MIQAFYDPIFRLVGPLVSIESTIYSLKVKDSHLGHNLDPSLSFLIRSSPSLQFEREKKDIFKIKLVRFQHLSLPI